MDVTLQGRFVRLEPLELRHAGALAGLTAPDRSLYKWSLVPHGEAATLAYVETALRWKAEGTALAFATIRVADGRVVGSTRFFDIERFPWPQGHPRHGRNTPDVCEIGYTWLAPDAVRTAINTEAKLLMLTHAFETWDALRVCLQTDERNARSRAAIERLGARFEGILRASRWAADNTPRDSARYSIVAAEWPAIKERLGARLVDRATSSCGASTRELS